MNLFRTKGVHLAVCSRKGTYYEKISSGITTNQTRSPTASSLCSQLA
jgi:hypothetical protein